MTKACFLDRDGVINEEVNYLHDPAKAVLIPGAAAAINRLHAAGYLAIVVTNQAGVAKGLYEEKDIRAVHDRIAELLAADGAEVDAFFYCPHHPDKGYPEENPAYKIPCECRKPKTGMIEKAAERFNIDLKESWMIGDTTMDIQTGVNAGMRTALVLTGEAGKDKKYDVKPDLVCENLLDAVEKILKSEDR